VIDGRSPVDSDVLSVDLSLNLKWLLVLVDMGLIKAGVVFFRKSRYADGGVIGVLRASSLLRKPGEPAMGLRNSEGKVPEPGVWREDEVLVRFSKPAAAMVAVIADIVVFRCFP
jgi:hypothetical protein